MGESFCKYVLEDDISELSLDCLSSASASGLRPSKQEMAEQEMPPAHMRSVDYTPLYYVDSLVSRIWFPRFTLISGRMVAENKPNALIFQTALAMSAYPCLSVPHTPFGASRQQKLRPQAQMRPCATRRERSTFFSLLVPFSDGWLRYSTMPNQRFGTRRWRA